MQKIGFTEALDSIVASDPRYQREAYIFCGTRSDFYDQTTEEAQKVRRFGMSPGRNYSKVSASTRSRIWPDGVECSFSLGRRSLRGYWAHGLSISSGPAFSGRPMKIRWMISKRFMIFADAFSETVSARACRYRQEIVIRSARPKGQLSRLCCEADFSFMLNRANLKGAATMAVAGDQFSANTAQRWTLANGLTIIVQEDRSAPGGQCAGVVRDRQLSTEDKHLGAGLSHILEHMLFKGTKTRSTNEIAQKIQDVGGYINAYTSFDRTVFWIDVPKDGALTALDILADAMMNSTLPAQEYAKEQEVIRREFAMGMDDPDRMDDAPAFRNRVSATSLSAAGDRARSISTISSRAEQVMEYYKTRYVPNNLTFIVVGDVVAAEVREKLEDLFKDQPAKSLAPLYIPAEPPQLGLREVHQEFATELTHFAMAWHVPEISHPDVPALDLLSGNSR